MRAFVLVATLIAALAEPSPAAGGSTPRDPVARGPRSTPRDPVARGPRWIALSPPAERVERRATRIYNGEPTGKFPAVAGLVFLRADGAVGLCSATLVAPRIVVTAAHCFIDAPVRAIAAFFPDGMTEEDYEATAYLLHPDFDPDVLAYADIALVALERDVAGVTPMPLAAVKPRPRTAGIIIGFGQNETGEVGSKEMGTVRLKACPRVFRPAGIGRRQLSASLCWRPKKRGHDTCQGDSGGPLVVFGEVAGVTSGGYPPCPGKLSWDTSVPAFRQWIDAGLADAANLP
jgi:hypothetical protein